MDADKNPTFKAQELLVSVLEEQKFLIEVRAEHIHELERFNAKWEELAEKLNILEGARKTAKQWREIIKKNVLNVI